jgi:AraC-like DNA-binding protein
MKLIFENFTPDEGSSFRILTPRLHDFFYWHFHPEYEIVFITGADGTRHVGEHISRFEGSDLVLIGPHIPHLNFDYGIKTPYEKIVVHIKEDFLERSFKNFPELMDIQSLFLKVRNGICFNKKTKEVIGERLMNLVKMPRFEQFIEILSIFQYLATSNEYFLLHSKPIEQHYNLKEQQRLKSVHRYIEDHYQEKIDISKMAELTHLSNAAFCRYFKKMTLMTFTEFLNQYRINQAKKLLILDKNVTETCYECGFESLSYFNRTFKKVVGENPLQFKKKIMA